MKTNKLIIFALVCLVSMMAWAKQDKVLRIFKGGEIIQEHNVEDIDYIEIQDLISAPEDVNATVAATSITIKWSPVEGATYDVYRSPDNVSFTQIATGLTATTYTDENPLKGSNFYRVKAVIDGVESGYTASVSGALPDNGLESGIYLGINAFNQQLYKYPVLLLNEASLSGFNDFIDGLTMKNGTLQFYAVDEAINIMQGTSLPSDVSTVALVTFTDGLDQGSFMMNSTYESNAEYLNAIQKRIQDETIAGQNITAYSIGLKGDDVKDIATFRDNLRKLASSDENATEVTSMSEVNAKFQEIAEKLSSSNYVQTINLTIPGLANGTKVRFTFDNVKDASNSKIYLDGVFNLKEKSLDDIDYHGLSSTSGTSVKGKVDGIFVTFTFEKVRTEDNVLIKSEFTDEWTFITSNSTWQINSEFDKTENSDIENQRSSAAIMLVLDCSNSLGEQFATAQSNAKGFIKTLYEASGFSSNPENPDEPGKTETTIYSTKPLDLSVAVWKDGTRYYLTPEQYKNANLTGYNVEGLTVLSALGNFIISPNLLQSNSPFVEYAMKYYEEVLPDKDQASVISARYQDINKALNNLGWKIFSTDPYDRYMTKTAYDDSYNYQIYLYWYTGGNLASWYSDSSKEYRANVTYGLIRGVKELSNNPIVWGDPRDLTLAVKKDGVRTFIKSMPEDLSIYDEVEGVAVFMGDQKFIIKLQNEQSGSITKDMAMSLYESILPTKDQAEVISLKYSDINNALAHFGGTAFNTNGTCYMTKTAYNETYNYQINLSYATGGKLDSNAVGYIRGVITIEE